MLIRRVIKKTALVKNLKVAQSGIMMQIRLSRSTSAVCGIAKKIYRSEMTKNFIALLYTVLKKKHTIILASSAKIYEPLKVPFLSNSF